MIYFLNDNEKRIEMKYTLSQLYSKTDRERFHAYYAECEKDRPDTFFFADFMVAEAFGMKGVSETMKGCGLDGDDKSKWEKLANKRYTKYQLTELYVVLCHLMEFAFVKGLNKLAEYYYERLNWIKEQSYNWTREEQEHFFYVTD